LSPVSLRVKQDILVSMYVRARLVFRLLWIGVEPNPVMTLYS
jgi:hypothetical protein